MQAQSHCQETISNAGGFQLQYGINNTVTIGTPIVGEGISSNGSFSVLNGFIPIPCALVQPSLNVWPGDINLDGIVNNQDDALLFLQFNYNGNTIPRQQQGINWQPYSCPDWGFQVEEAHCNDIKHFDCNGDGSININDKNTIVPDCLA